MLSLVRHFGNIDLQQTKAPDITFFNVVGSWMVHYPAALNALFIIMTNIVLLAGLVIGLVRKQIRGRGLVAGIFAFPVVLIILFFISSGVLQVIRSASPLYDGYYDNAYNTGYYFFALAVLGIAVFALLYQWMFRKFNMPSLWIGVMLWELIAMDLLYRAIPNLTPQNLLASTSSAGRWDCRHYKGSMVILQESFPGRGILAIPQ